MKTGIVSLTFACALILTGVSTVAQAVPPPSGQCEQVGAKKKHKGQVFVCTKKGKKAVWVKKVNRPSKPVVNEPPQTIESTDPVTAKLERMMATLPMPNLNAPAPPIRFILEEPSDQEFIPRLEKQFLYLAQAFPEFSWNAPGIAFIPRSKEWLGTAMREAGCQERTVQRTVSYYSVTAEVWGTGVMDCNSNVGQVGIIGLNTARGLHPGYMWDMIVSQEFLEPIRSKRFASNPLSINSSHPIGWWDVNFPSWMREGGEPAFNSIATAMQTRKWEMIRLQPFWMCGTGVLRDYAPMILNSYDCHYPLGTEALELMLALYGWDAPTAWLSGYGNQRDPYVAFKNAYGDDYETFERYASEFFQWRANKVPMSDELLNRLR